MKTITLPPWKGLTADLPQGPLSEQQLKDLDNTYHRRCEVFSRLFGPIPDFHFDLVDPCKVPIACDLVDEGQRLELQFENGRKVCEDDFDSGEFMPKYKLERERLGLDYILKIYKSIQKESEAAKLPVPKMKIVCHNRQKKSFGVAILLNF